MSTRPITEGQTWVSRGKGTRTAFRTVVMTSGDLILYVAGGRNRMCRRRAFRAWIRRYRCIATRGRRKRSMQLRQPITPATTRRPR